VGIGPLCCLVLDSHLVAIAGDLHLVAIAEGEACLSQWSKCPSAAVGLGWTVAGIAGDWIEGGSPPSNPLVCSMNLGLGWSSHSVAEKFARWTQTLIVAWSRWVVGLPAEGLRRVAAEGWEHLSMQWRWVGTEDQRLSSPLSCPTPWVASGLLPSVMWCFLSFRSFALDYPVVVLLAWRMAAGEGWFPEKASSLLASEGRGFQPAFLLLAQV